MKLIDVLVGSGDGMSLFGLRTKYLAMDPDGRVYGYTEMPTPGIIGWSVPDNLYSTDGRGCLIQIDRDDVDGQWQSAIITREQYEAALTAKNEGWIEWGGGECPVSDRTIVEVRYRNGEVKAAAPADFYEWGHGRPHFVTTGCDIIAYRLHQPQKAEQDKADDEADLNECIGQDAAPVWNGDGLPPVGCECEFISNDKSWGSVVVIGMDGDKVVIKPSGETYYGITPSEKQVFRPTRSEADKKREEAAQALCTAGGGNGNVDEESGYGSCWFDVYDAIAAGKIPGVKLED